MDLQEIYLISFHFQFWAGSRSVKNRYWDGKVRLFSIKTNKIYIGLLPYVDEFCRERGYKFEGIHDVIGDKTRITDEDVDFFINGDDLVYGLGLPFQHRDYQIDAFKTDVQYGRQLLLSLTTASGKSLIIYMLCRWFEGEMSLPNCKTIIIVPTTSLVEQMAKDFEEYGYDEKICKIYSGQVDF